MLTVGQMARIFSITAKTLRHYEAIGLFSPSEIGEDNLYRYYAPEQIVQLRRILFFRSAGLGLEVIRELHRSGAMDDPVRIGVMLQEHATALREEINCKQNLLTTVEELLGTIHYTGGNSMKAQIVTLQAFTVVGMAWTSGDSESISDLWVRFLPQVGEIQGKVNPQISYGVCDPNAEGAFAYIAGYETDGASVPEGMVSKRIPTQTYAVFTHRGSVRTISKTMEHIYQTWLPQNGYKAVKGMDLEWYGERFISPEDENSEVDLYIPIEVIR